MNCDDAGVAREHAQFGCSLQYGSRIAGLLRKRTNFVTLRPEPADMPDLARL